MNTIEFFDETKEPFEAENETIHSDLWEYLKKNSHYESFTLVIDGDDLIVEGIDKVYEYLCFSGFEELFGNIIFRDISICGEDLESQTIEERRAEVNEFFGSQSFLYEPENYTIDNSEGREVTVDDVDLAIEIFLLNPDNTLIANEIEYVSLLTTNNDGN